MGNSRSLNNHNKETRRSERSLRGDDRIAQTSSFNIPSVLSSVALSGEPVSSTKSATARCHFLAFCCTDAPRPPTSGCSTSVGRWIVDTCGCLEPGRFFREADIEPAHPPSQSNNEHRLVLSSREWQINTKTKRNAKLTTWKRTCPNYRLTSSLSIVFCVKCWCFWRSSFDIVVT